MKEHLRFLREQHSLAIRWQRAASWEVAAAEYRGMAAAYRIAAIALIALIRRAEEKA